MKGDSLTHSKSDMNRGTLQLVCAACRRVKNQDGAWVAAAAPIGPAERKRYTHGYCPECAETFLDAYFRLTKGSEPETSDESDEEEKPGS